MGLGFTVGPFLGGHLGEVYGIRAKYLVAAVFALVGFAIARLGFVTVPQGEQTEAIMLEFRRLENRRCVLARHDAL